MRKEKTLEVDESGVPYPSCIIKPLKEKPNSREDYITSIDLWKEIRELWLELRAKLDKKIDELDRMLRK